MKKRLTAMALCAAMLLGMCGCGSIFDKEYSSVTDYVAAGDSSSEGKDTVRNYYALKQAILRLVDARKESGVVAFGEYDGDISTDLKSACWELRTQNALCAYCVESISYDLNHIVSYDEATMHIAYSRSQQDIDQVVTVSYSTDIKDYLADAINALGKRVVLLVNNSALDEEGVKALVSEIYTEDPLCAVSLPQTTVYMYSGSGLQRLFDIGLSYGGADGTVSSEKKLLGAAADTGAKACADAEPSKAALKICEYLVARCIYKEASGSTAYDALMRGRADSEGMALAFKALCEKLGIECSTVKGLKDLKDHWWNIITIGADSYHVDVSLCRESGVKAGFLRSDMDMWGAYRWDTASYPECRGALTYADVSK